MATLSLASIAFSLPSLTVVSTNTPKEFSVCNASPNSVSNGGQCCLFTAPAGTTWVTFEMWGGGSGGSGGCCCMNSQKSAGAGTYVIKTVTAATTGGLAGCAYTICAAGTTGCVPGSTGQTGNTSFATGYGLSNFCAPSTLPGCSGCQPYYSCYTCYVMCQVNCGCGGDLNIAGATGSAIQTQFCNAYGLGFTAVAPATTSGAWIGPNGCNVGGGSNGTYGYAPTPGGGGQPASVYGGGCCWGGFGAQGHVSVTYG